MNRPLVSLSLLLLVLAACGARADPGPTLARLREMITEPISSPVQLEDHNQLVEDVVSSGTLEGMRQFQVQEHLGRGAECGVRELCASRGFRASDWVYEVGRDPQDTELPAGPTLIVGFDSTGIVTRTYYLSRR